MSRIMPTDYASLLAEVKARVRSAQYSALKSVNKELVGLYWDIGRIIVDRQTDAAHGAAIAEQLAADLRLEFPGVSGYSRRNIFYMREFFLAYRDLPKVQPLVAQKPIGVATYHTVKRLPKEFKGLLPTPEQIIKLLENTP
ncbi:MAG TPA: DUF1016 N-terminal domain-containing protein [Verrucomicrobiae bacterium]